MESAVPLQMVLLPDKLTTGKGFTKTAIVLLSVICEPLQTAVVTNLLYQELTDSKPGFKSLPVALRISMNTCPLSLLTCH